MIRSWVAVGILLLVSNVSAQQRTAADLKKALAEINQPISAKLDMDAAEKQRALQRLRAIRYLAELPYADVVLDDEYNKLAQAAAMICQKLGTLDHAPRNPGLPEAEYQFAKRGAGSSSLGMGVPHLSAAMDGWMDDSDMSNIDRLGHRRWCLNPALLKLGLGRVESFTAMYCFDMSRTKIPDFEFVAWPARVMPAANYFGPKQAWNVSFNPAKFQMLTEAAKARVFVLGLDGEVGAELKLDYHGFNNDGFGVPYCLVFRPEKLSLAAGKRYLVKVSGVKTKAGAETPIQYDVRFVSVQ